VSSGGLVPEYHGFLNITDFLVSSGGLVPEYFTLLVVLNWSSS
jgi:hypothetical protein